ncbi:endonuclease domain-containing protein [Candidatus Gracilibacteria bacterium 28_42_T64]|nr:endonuclease domain-containing protein [Candidatus Gracilibacteria bacterium 28_42_T64]
MYEFTQDFLHSRGLILGNHRLPYNPKLKERARELRKNMTKPEMKIWFDFLKNWKYTVLRQRPIDHFIVDFYCKELSLVIEIDGESHHENGAPEYDTERTNVLKGYDLKILRFTNDEIMKNFSGVCEILNKY